MKTDQPTVGRIDLGPTEPRHLTQTEQRIMDIALRKSVFISSTAELCPACGALPCDQTIDPLILITQANDALQAMWDHFGDLSDNDMLAMPCKDALIKCRSALAAIAEARGMETESHD